MRRRISHIAFALAALPACTGVIGPAPTPPGGMGGAGGSGPVVSPPAAPDVPPAPLDPGRVTLHRLTRREYNNTVRDLLGTQLRPADGFPSDPAGFGYDNNSDVQSLSPLQLDQYLTAAEQLVEAATAGGVSAFAMRAQIPACDLAADAGCQGKLVRAFARRAFRRPISDGELARLLEPAAAARALGDDPLGQLKLALRAVLSSPHFLFRVELDPEPASPAPHLLTHHEAASRLSYFLWSSMPDATLLGEADGGKLGTPAELRAQAVRLLGDSRAGALVSSFGGQWLSLPALRQHEVDADQFAYDAPFAALLESETRAFLRELLAQELPVSQLLLAPFTFVNDRLASHYGLPPVGSETLTRVMLTGDRRRGLLTQASILTRTSFPARTSPTVRGAWVVTHLLCEPPPPPPANVPAFPEPVAGAPRTVRQRLDAHRANPSCASCHALIDPVGFGLENYDLVGRWRTMEGGVPIDASGAFPGGGTFDGAGELSALIAGDPRLVPCIARNLLTYALGRGLQRRDDRSLAEIIQRATAGASLRALILEVVSSAPFRMRRGEPAEEKP